MKITDGLMAYLIGQLEKFDETLNLPLNEVTWGRDLPINTVPLILESTSYQRVGFGAVGTRMAQGLPVIAPNANTLPAIQVQGTKVTNPVVQYGRELRFTALELQRSQALGTPLDMIQLEGLRAIMQSELDQLAYVGNGSGEVTGLANSALVTAGNAAAPAGAAYTADELLAVINEILVSAMNQSGGAVCPSKLLVYPAFYAALMGKLDNGSGMSIYQYVTQTCIAAARNGRPLVIESCKWLGKDLSGLSKDRIVAYTPDRRYVQFPVAPLARQPESVQSIVTVVPYMWAAGSAEIRYPETVLYRDVG